MILDPRVRQAAFEALLNIHRNGHKLDSGTYQDLCKALKDDYEGVRMVGLALVSSFENPTYIPLHEIPCQVNSLSELNIFLDQSLLLLLANLIYADSQFFPCGSYGEQFY